MDHESELASRLSLSQTEIVTFPPSYDHILSVRAGPGSGKTLTIAHRIAWLLKNGFEPENILILSMTNRAVNSLSRHLQEIDHVDCDQLHISTFHSFCAGLVDNYGELIDGNMVRRRLMDDLCWRNFSSLFLGKSMAIAGKKMDGNLTPVQLEKLLLAVRTEELTIDEATVKFSVSKPYIEELLSYLDKNGMMRYLDFLTDALKLLDLSKDPSVPNQWIPQLAKYKAVIVDEFQDMHFLLLKIIKAVVKYPTYDQQPNSSKHLTVAGDANQCIYEFLGSYPTLIEQLPREFPNMQVNQLSIEETFRLPPEILKVATEVALKANNLPYNANLHSTRLPTHKPILYSKASPNEEYSFIAQEISRLILQLGGLLQPSDFIVLTRTNKELDSIKSHFDNYGLRSNILSLTNPWIKSKVHVFLDILTILNSGPGSDFGLLCAIKLIDTNQGARLRLSKLFVASENWRAGRDIQMLESFILQGGKDLQAIYKTQTATLASIEQFLQRIGDERQKLTISETPEQIIESLHAIINDSKIMTYMNYPDSKISDLGLGEQISGYKLQLEYHLNQFYTTLETTYQRWNSEENSSFLEYFLRTYNDDITIGDNQQINLSTVHTAKGLEFPIVFIPGTSTTFAAIPYWSNVYRNIAIEPEKARLFYVAATRASHLLYAGVNSKLDRYGYPGFVNDNFTRQLPNLSAQLNSRGNLLENLAHDFNRKVTTNNVIKGANIYNTLFRSLHTITKARFRVF